MPPVETSRVNEAVASRPESQQPNYAFNEIRESVNAYQSSLNPQAAELANANLVSENALPNMSLEYATPTPTASSATNNTYYDFTPADAEPAQRLSAAQITQAQQFESQYMANTQNAANAQYQTGYTTEGYPTNGSTYGGTESTATTTPANSFSFSNSEYTPPVNNGSGSDTNSGSTSTSTQTQAQSESQLKAAEKTMSASSINQGDYGDCFYDSAVSAMAETSQGRAQLAKEISVNADGSYQVTFAGEKSEPITVSNQDISQYGLTNKNLEANVLEAAFLKMNNVTPGNTGSDDMDNALIQYPEQAESLLSGKNAAFAWTQGQSDAQLAKTLSGASDGQLVTVTSNDNYNGTESNNPVVGDHQYTVIGYNSSTGTVTLRNPWGDEDGTAIAANGSTADGITNKGNGDITMNMDTFAKYFCATDTGAA